MKALRIIRCRDPLMWYAGMVGQIVPYCGQWPEAFKSREPAGYINRVEFEDAEVVDMPGPENEQGQRQARADGCE